MQTMNMPAEHYGLSLILGGAEGTLLEMTNIYASLSRVLVHYGHRGAYFSGEYHKANFDFTVNSAARQMSPQAEIFNASSIWYTYQAMVEVNRPDEETGWQSFGSSRKIAWKTGTSFGYRDGWAIGTSPEYVVGVWFGNADGEGRPGLTGVATAAPLMFDIFGLLPGREWFAAPVDELLSASLCKASGYLAGPNCPEPDDVKIPLKGLRSPACPFHKVVHLTADRRHRVTSDCYPVGSMIHTSWFVLPPVQEWYYKKSHSDYKQLPPFRPGCEQNAQRSMDLVYPHDGVKLFIPRELKGEKGRVVFEAVHNNPDASIYWHLDDQFITTTKFIHQVALAPHPGRHVLILVDENGEELIRNFEVVEP
jgi:penicillin-binding protein 1C